MVYVHNPQTVAYLKGEIWNVLDEIDQNLCELVIENFAKRVKVGLINSSSTKINSQKQKAFYFNFKFGVQFGTL